MRFFQTDAMARNAARPRIVVAPSHPPPYKITRLNMKRILSAAVIMATALMIREARAQAPLPPEVEDPECLGVNKEPAHATLMPYASLKEALAANRHASSFCRSLNGKWKFNWVAHPAQRPVDFYKPDFDVSPGRKSRCRRTGNCWATARPTTATSATPSRRTGRMS